MNSADLVARLRAQAKASCRREEGEDWRDDYRWLAADRIEALEAWKAEAMEVLRPFARSFNSLVNEHVELGAGTTYDDYAAARHLVEKEEGR